MDDATQSSERLPPPNKLPEGWLSRYPWVTFVLPFIVFMVLTSFEPTPPEGFDPKAAKSAEELNANLERAEALQVSAGGMFPKIPYRYYPWVYSLKVLLVMLTMLAVLPGYRTFPWRFSFLSIVVGTVGVVLWIVLCRLEIEPKILGPIDRTLGVVRNAMPGLEDRDPPSLGLLSLLGSGERSGYNPLLYMSDQPGLAWLFLAVRIVGMALMVPVIEEFFLRGFLMRYVVHEQWWQVPFGTATRAALVVGTGAPMLMHPAELLAAFVWFSMVSWLMVRTRNIWDCVIAHAVTNFLLAVYVIVFNQWQLM